MMLRALRAVRAVSIVLAAMLLSALASDAMPAWSQQGGVAPGNAPAGGTASGGAPPPDPQADVDPPARAARLSYVEGSVSLQPAGVQDWNSAPLNQPLTPGDALWSDDASRAELDLGSAVVRVDQDTSIALLDLTDQLAQLRLTAGNVDVTVSELDPAGGIEIDAPNAAVVLLRPGEYRLGVDNAGDTSVAIRSGQAQVVLGEDQTINLLTGQRGLFAAGGSYALSQAGPPDDFDRWSQQRQARYAEDSSVSQYVSSDAVGYQDLNENGQWQQQPDYGYVWYPDVAEDWAPYSAGHWSWVAPWGWSWVDDAPWGFAPFHYGRWIHPGRRWAWVPAPARRHALYAPALVAWVGGPGAGASLSLGGGTAVGWLPLAPGEVYVPGYRVSARYLQNVNLSNSSSLTAATISTVAANPALQSRYANRVVPHAVTVVPQINFTAGQPVARHVMAPPPEFISATPAARVPAIIPARESVLGAVSLMRVARPPARLADRAVMTQREPPPAYDAFALTPSRTAARPAARPANSPPADAPPANALRRIPERSPQFQQPAQSPNPNVFQQRDQELEAQRQAQLREQTAQELLRRQQQQVQTQIHQQSQQQVQLQQQRESQERQQAQLQPPRQPPPPHPYVPPAATSQRPQADSRRGTEPAP